MIKKSLTHQVNAIYKIIFSQTFTIKRCGTNNYVKIIKNRRLPTQFGFFPRMAPGANISNDNAIKIILNRVNGLETN